MPVQIYNAQTNIWHLLSWIGCENYVTGIKKHSFSSEPTTNLNNLIIQTIFKYAIFLKNSWMGIAAKFLICKYGF